MTIDVHWLRSEFPGLDVTDLGQRRIYLDAPPEDGLPGLVQSTYNMATEMYERLEVREEAARANSKSLALAV